MSTVGLDFKVLDINRRFKEGKLIFDPRLTYLFDLQRISYKRIEEFIEALEKPNDRYGPTNYEAKMGLAKEYDQLMNIVRLIEERVQELNAGRPAPTPKQHRRKLNIHGNTEPISTS